MASILVVRDMLISTQLHCTLVPLFERSAQRLLEYAGDDGEGSLSWHSLVGEDNPTTTGRRTSLPIEILVQTDKGNVRGSLDEFVMRIRRYAGSCEGVLSGCMRFAGVQMGRDGNDLRRHLLARVDWLTERLLMREEVRSIITACDTPTVSAPTVLLDRLDRVMKDEFDAKILGSVGSDQLAEAKFLNQTAHWYEQQMCSSWPRGARCVTVIAVLPGRTDTRTVTKTRTASTKTTDEGACDASEPLESFRTATVLDRPDGRCTAKAARSASTEPETLDWMRTMQLVNLLKAHDELGWLHHAQDVEKYRDAQTQRGQAARKLNSSDSI